jgi:1,4-alpha-glucan branching enzyme
MKNIIDKTKQSGMGAIALNENGFAFRVWAPNAEKMFVTGDFNQWNQENNPMDKEDNGTWYIEIKTAKLGDNYRYVIHNQGNIFEKRDPYSRKISSEKNASEIYMDNYNWKNQEFQIPSWNELVLYEMHVGTFNQNNCSDKPATFDDSIKKIPYLKRLGINAISIMPIAAFNGELSWGYNPCDIYAVENTYGGPEAFKRFIDECHENGIAVILDIVYNHAGPENLDLWQFDGSSTDNKGGIYFYQDNRSTTPWGDTRYDYGRGEVRNYLKDNLMMWLNEYRLDGARFDATHYIRKVNPGADDTDIQEGWSFLQWLNQEKNTYQPYKIMIAEDMANEPWIVKTVGEGGVGFNAQWDTEFVNRLRSQLIAPQDSQRNMQEVKLAIEKKYNNDAFQRIIYSESHDDVANGKARITYEIDQTDSEDRSFFSKKRSLLGAGITLTSPGIPMLFQGQEMLEDKWFEDTDPIDWFLAEKYKGIVNAYRDLIQLRRNWKSKTKGLQGQNCDVFHINEEKNVIGYHRWQDGGAGDDVVIIANFSNQAYDNYNIGMPRPGMWKVRFNSSSHQYDKYIDEQFSYDTEATEGENDSHAWNANTGLGAYALVILSQD